LRGLLLLHSFEYDDALEEFRIAQKIAPGFAMAYWGEAMTANGPLTGFQDREAARSALSRLAPTAAQRSALAATDREKGYLRAVEILFGDGEKEGRDFAYADAMKRLAETYANDPNAASFYALALLGACHRGRDFRIYMNAAAVLEEVLDKNPEHPGALHYLIHSYDDPIHAPLGLRAARIYAKVAPAAAHALHMPSHIFVAMGMWDDVAASNEDSWAASEARVASKNLRLEDRGYHSLWWLEYAYLQQGRFEDALRALTIVQQDVKTSPSRLIRFHLLQMCTAYAIETGTPCSPPDGIDASDLDLPAAAAALFARGMISLNRGDRIEAESLLAGLRKLREAAQGDPSSAQAGHHNHLFAGDSEAVGIMEKELQALLLMEDGQSRKAIELMIEATAAEDRTSFDFGPPLPPKPSHELFGEILLRLGQPGAARKQFEMALIRAPKRALSLLGLSRALAEMGDKIAARQTLTELRTMWRRADTQLKEALDRSLARL
jgi:tetratricopeptide (TPR) repeat protein